MNGLVGKIRHMCSLVGGNALLGLVRQLRSKVIGWCFLLKKRPAKAHNCYITCTGKTDGIGAQVQAIFSTMLFAQEFGMTYVHTPFDKVWGSGDAKEWEDFFNLGKSEIAIDDIDTGSLNVVYIDQPLFIRFKPNTLYVVQHCHSFADSGSNARLYSNIVDRLVEKYRSSPKEKDQLFNKSEKVNIAIHVRRGDVSETGIHSERYTNNLHYKSLLNSLIKMLNELKIGSSIHLYSQGSAKDFYDLEDFNIHYHLDECVFTTFDNIVEADVIIMSKSTFSYTAALLSKAIIIYEPFWHKPLQKWISLSTKDKKGYAALEQTHLRQSLRSLVWIETHE